MHGQWLYSDIVLYMKRKEVGRGLVSLERSVREEGNSLGFYVANSEEKLIRGVAAAETITTEDNKYTSFLTDKLFRYFLMQNSVKLTG